MLFFEILDQLDKNEINERIEFDEICLKVKIFLDFQIMQQQERIYEYILMMK